MTLRPEGCIGAALPPSPMQHQEQGESPFHTP
jgi:hypothetical protein